MLEQCPNTFHFQDLHHKKSKYCDRIECIKNKKRLLHFHDTASILWIDRIDSLSDKEFDALVSSVKDLALKIIDESPNIPNEASIAIKNIKSSSFVINFVSSNMSISMLNKQNLLEAYDASQRLNILSNYIEEISSK